MKFAIYVTNKRWSSCNGGDMVLRHIGCGLKELGHEAVYLDLSEPIPAGTDYVFFAAYWFYTIEPFLKESKAKRICHLETFDANREIYPWAIDIKAVIADYFITYIKGECVEWAEKYIGKKIIHFPLAGCGTCNIVGNKSDSFSHDAVYVGHRTPVKNFTWLNEAGVEIMNCSFDELSDLYVNTKVVPYLSSDFQKGIVTDLFQKPGFGVTERLFQVPLCGGFTIGDDSVDVREFFNEDEVICCPTKEKYIDTIKYFVKYPEERIPYINRARERVLKDHLYKHRLINLFNQICL